MEYLGLKAFHIMSFTAWFAMLFYLPRLFVYHAENREKKEFVEVIKVMELKLYKYIGVPSFWATVISGMVLIMLNPAVFQQGWIHAKITLIILLAGYFFHSGFLRRQLEKDEDNHSGKYFRFYNEIPTLFLIVIVLLAVVKPF